MTVTDEKLAKIRRREADRVRATPLRYVAMLPHLTKAAAAKGEAIPR